MWMILNRNPKYAVNEKGEIKSVRKNRVLSPKVNHDGYLRIQLYDKGKCEFVSVHRLIGEAFLPKPLPGQTVINHINGDKQDNRIENLEWMTQKENIAHAWSTGLSHSHLNLNGKRVRQYTADGKTLIAEYPSTMDVERNLGIPHTNISYSSKYGTLARGYRWEVITA